jgi:hypothetical protein
MRNIYSSYDFQGLLIALLKCTGTVKRTRSFNIRNFRIRADFSDISGTVLSESGMENKLFGLKQFAGTIYPCRKIRVSDSCECDVKTDTDWLLLIIRRRWR